MDHLIRNPLPLDLGTIENNFLCSEQLEHHSDLYLSHKNFSVVFREIDLHRKSLGWFSN